MTAAAGWDEAAALAKVSGWFHRIGDGWPAGLSMVSGPAGALADRFGADIAAALDAQDDAAPDRAFAEFRRGFGPIWREWQTRQAGDGLAS